MTWYLIHDKDGVLISQGTVISDMLPDDYTVITLKDRPLDTDMWDETARAFIPRPAKVVIDKIQDIKTDPEFADFQAVTEKLSLSDRQTIDDTLIKLLGDQRYESAAATEADRAEISKPL